MIEDPTAPAPMLRALECVRNERAYQDGRWGDQSHLPDGTGADLPASFRGATVDAQRLVALCVELGNLTWRHVLLEEVAEALEAPDPDALRGELVQVAAVAVAWIEALDRRSS